MSSVKVTVVGNLATDIQHQQDEKGKDAALFTIAGDKDDNGTRAYLNAIVYRRQAVNVLNSLALGDRVIVTGSLSVAHGRALLVATEVGLSLRYGEAQPIEEEARL